MDKFFTQKHCDRCKSALTAGRIMSMFNTDCICMACADKERMRADYDRAHQADVEQIQKGNRNFKGIGFK